MYIVTLLKLGPLCGYGRLPCRVRLLYRTDHGMMDRNDRIDHDLQERFQHRA